MHWLAIDFRSIGRWSMDWLVDGSCVWLVCGLVVDILKLANCRVATQPAITTAICARIFASPASTFLFLFPQADFPNYRCPLVPGFPIKTSILHGGLRLGSRLQHATRSLATGSTSRVAASNLALLRVAACGLVGWDGMGSRDEFSLW